eukprot:212750_1
MAELLNQSNCNDSSNTEKFVEWKEKAKTKLKNTIESNLNRRNIKLAQIVTATTKHMYSAQCLISASLNNIFTRVDEWRGVNISAMHTAPKTFEEYYRRADNWWNRMKAQWLGDYYFYPFFHTDLHQFMANIPNNHSTSNEHMYFRILHAIFNTEIHYPRARPYPLILHTTFIKSKSLKSLFHQIGVRTCIAWQVPLKNNDVNNCLSNFYICTCMFPYRPFLISLGSKPRSGLKSHPK